MEVICLLGKQKLNEWEREYRFTNTWLTYLTPSSRSLLLEMITCHTHWSEGQ